MRSINLKVGLLYLFLAILNISFFIIINFENQIDLITENTKYKTKEKANKIYAKISQTEKYVKLHKNDYRADDPKIEKKIIDKIVSNLKDLKIILLNYAIFDENNHIFYQSNKNFQISDFHKKNALISITNKDLMGEPFYIEIKEKDKNIYFYIPLDFDGLSNTVIFFDSNLKIIKSRVNQLYRIAIIIVVSIILLHIIFAFILYKMIINPIKMLSDSSIKISGGDLSARVKINQNDEIGLLGLAFNKMAESIQDKINKLNTQHNIIQEELEMAGEVQSGIFPDLSNIKGFEIGLFFKPLGKVSGDYYDHFDMGSGKHGFLLADVSGHGVPAALITMFIKELFKIHVKSHIDPKDIFLNVNRDAIGIMENYSAFFTAFYIVFDDDKIHYSSAAHTQSIKIDNVTNEISFLETKGFLIGVSTDIGDVFKSQKNSVSKGDKIILYTDGLIEGRNIDGEQYGMDRFLTSIQKSVNFSPTNMVSRIKDDFFEFLNETSPQDDLTILVIEYKGK